MWTIARCETAGKADELCYSNFAQTFFKRQIFAEGHKMEFVVGREQPAPMTEYIQAIVKYSPFVAIERHAKVTFESNYDIKKEDKGKISTYR